MDNNTFNILILIVGLLSLFLGLAPIMSRLYFNEMHEKFWKSKREFMSKENTYIYSRYIRQIAPLMLGTTLTGYALYKLFF